LVPIGLGILQGVGITWRISQNSEMTPKKSWRMLQLVCSGFCEQTLRFFRHLGYNFGICSYSDWLPACSRLKNGLTNYLPFDKV
jgi:hypothetical protein